MDVSHINLNAGGVFMSLKSFGAKIAIGITMLVVGVFADQLTITGTVKDSAGAAVAGAIVRAGNGGTALRDTTDATGAYTLVIANNTATSVMVIVQTGTGIGGGFTMGTATVAAPGDGTADAATVNLVVGTIIQPFDGDTAVISGTVKDSSGAAVANVVVTVRFGGGGVGFGGLRDTTDASGTYSIRAVNTNSSTTVTVTATLTPRTGTATGTIAAPADGIVDRVTANIVIGQRVNPVLKTPAITPLRTTQSVVGVYLLNGCRVNKMVMTNAKTGVPRTAIVKYQNKAEVKLLLNK